jgi:hypothetical protein
MVDGVYRSHPDAVKAILDRFVAEQGILDPKNGRLIGHGPTAVMSFSDSVVRIAEPAYNQNVATTIGREIGAIKKMQRSLATHFLSAPNHPGIFIRGGIAVGEIYYNPQELQIFGPAMNRAVEAEGLAKYPRIVIDPGSVNDFEKAFVEPLNNGAITRNLDDLLYVDYFSLKPQKIAKGRFGLSGINAAITGSILREETQRMKYALETRLQTHSDDELAIIEKYHWAAERHNETVSHAVQSGNLSQTEAANLTIDFTG